VPNHESTRQNKEPRPGVGAGGATCRRGLRAANGERAGLDRRSQRYREASNRV